MTMIVEGWAVDVADDTRGDTHADDAAAAPAEPTHGTSGHPSHHVPEHLVELEHRLGQWLVAFEQTGGALAANTGRVVPAWRRVTAGEHRLPVTIAVLTMIALQARVPEPLSLTSTWVLPVIEVGILVILVASNPRRVTHASKRLRILSLLLIGVASLANGWSAGSLIVGLVQGREGSDAGSLLVTGGNIWLTNIVVFALWYWDLDRGGPTARARAERNKPDFLFPEMTAPNLADADWEPHFVDYLYLAFTNATAFSPTDTLPFSRWSKLAMMTQSTISLTTGALVIARAVNILH
jgi:uncharacterized membrane protein